jgi:hypothetical protein
MDVSSVEPRRKSILESPWYWVYAFCTAALVAVAIIGPKFAERQAQIERQAQGRERAAQQRAGKAPSTPMSTAESTYISLGPLTWTLAAVLVVAWGVLWWQHFRRRGILANSATANSATSGAKP